MEAEMIRRATWIASLVLLIATHSGSVVHGQAPTDAELRKLADAYTQAWAKGDAKAISNLHTNEAIRIGENGRVAVGRVAIEKALLEALAGPYRGTKLGFTLGQTTRAAQDVYVSEGSYALAGGMPPAGTPTRGRYLKTLVRVSGRWLIASDAAIAPPRPPK
jgi:uncharacterized protein (TIGR02246 family)